MHTWLPPLGCFGTTPLALVWLRRDLRLYDHHALQEALATHRHVLPLFIFDPDLLAGLERQDARVTFIYRTLARLHNALQALGSTLCIAYGAPLAVLAALRMRCAVEALYFNEDYEPGARARDMQVQQQMERAGVAVHTYQDQVILGPNAVCKADGSPYTIYTPYMRRWRATYHQGLVAPFAMAHYMGNLWQGLPLPLPSWETIGFAPTTQDLPAPRLTHAHLARYGELRDYPHADATTGVGIHLRFGTLSIREVTSLAMAHSQVWVNQLIWRNFFMAILYHFPHVVEGPFKPAYRRMAWRADEVGFAKWCAGETGFPLVDAGMRELRATGKMHGRVRMVAANFLCKLLLIDWRWGEAYFASKLLDYELAVNNGNWQWVAGTGCDAVPYFRIFNPAAN